MSEYDGNLDSGHESSGLSEAQENYHGDSDAHQALAAAGSHHQTEFDEHLVHAHHVEYDDAQGNHFEETSYEVIDVHVVESDSGFTAVGSDDSFTAVQSGDSFEAIQSHHGFEFQSSGNDAQSYGDVSFMHDELAQLLHHSDFEHGLDQQLAPGGDVDGLSGISEASA